MLTVIVLYLIAITSPAENEPNDLLGIEEQSLLSLSNLGDVFKRSSCVLACSGELVHRVHNIIALNATAERFIKLCASYKDARTCVYSGSVCSDNETWWFAIFTSGLEYACSEEIESFLIFMPCVEQFVMQDITRCDDKCGQRKYISDIFSTENMRKLVVQDTSPVSLLSQSGPLCGLVNYEII
uniref:CPG4 domain-containing protein n=1 Tax=Heterorhabditis bacteriophora TaxID=37862 RepID=A0A1I7XK19_HETBA